MSLQRISPIYPVFAFLPSLVSLTGSLGQNERS
jgi:hypothetical protein